MKHSLSPVMHNAAYQALNLPFIFGIEDVASQHLPDFFQNFAPDVTGLAVTAPLKHLVFSYLDAVEPMAATLGVVNTVVVTGKLRTGFNTDVYGIHQALLEAEVLQEKLGFDSLHALIVGAGATAVSALMACGELGVKNISLLARSFHKPPSAVKVAGALGIHPTIIPWKQPKLAEKAWRQADIVISTVPSAALAEFTPFLATNKRQVVVLEADYSHQNPLITDAVCAGGVYIPGTRMLLHQGTQQFTLHTGQPAPIEVMEAALKEELARKE